MKEAPLVSIALPVFNAENTLDAAIRSILFQTYKNWELIIINDGSSDGSLEIAKRYDDPRIKIIENKVNIRLTKSLNAALENSNGEYFARMDADDVSFPTRIEKQVNFLQQNNNIDLLGTGILYYHGDGIPIGILPVRERHEEICSRPWSGFYLPHPTWVGRKEWFMKHRYRECDHAEDSELLFRAYPNSRFACLPEVLLAYREEPRTLHKMLKYRKGFYKAIFHEAICTSNYYVAIRLTMLHPLKVIGDILNIKLGIKKLRNPILPIPSVLMINWKKVWKNANKMTEETICAV